MVLMQRSDAAAADASQSLDAREFDRSFRKFMQLEADHRKLAGWGDKIADTGGGMDSDKKGSGVGVDRGSTEGGLIAAATAAADALDAAAVRLREIIRRLCAQQVAHTVLGRL